MAFVVRGVVQGVGFRPFVHGLAVRHGLSGWVQNEGAHVAIEVEGRRVQIDGFARSIVEERPPLACIEEVQTTGSLPAGERGFRIRSSSVNGDGAGVVAPDAAMCTACEAELWNAHDRRYRHPFIACCHCGPRLTLALDVPYDRERTTMAPFELCAACRAEYQTAGGRRFHAQPIACHDCGPELFLLERGVRSPDPDPLDRAVRALKQGLIVAVKGVGGYHLACDATSAAAVKRLRRRKHRETKPFAVMVADLDAAERIAIIGAAERSALGGADRPILLCQARAGGELAPEVAPRVSTLGLMLPYAPLQHLLLRLVARPLVMTSGNRSGGAIAVSEADAVETLGPVADVILAHSREIVVPCEDSVVRVVADRRLPLRRSRGQAPQPIRLRNALVRPVLAVGGAFKSAFALGVGPRAILSPHFGDLDEPRSLDAWSRAIEHFEKLCRAKPVAIVHDLHPDYESTGYALARARSDGLTTVAVQHHHGHMAACMAEHGLDGEVIGVCFDGVGLGTDGTAWGGEFLVGGYRGVTRAAHFDPCPLPGGDAAVTAPWRMALAYLVCAGLDAEPWVLAPSAREFRAVRALIERGARGPTTSSVGRLFDAVAALVIPLSRITYDAEAAVRLECLASQSDDRGAYDLELLDTSPCRVGTRALFAQLVNDLRQRTPPQDMARRFHAGLVASVVRICRSLREDKGVDRVALSGGVFCNAWLARELPFGLEDAGFEVFRPERVPPNDGGLALGQLAVAAAGGGVVCQKGV